MGGGDHPASIDLPWLYEQVNDHRTSTVKIYVWLQYYLDGWNVKTERLLDFLIYSLFVTLLAWFAHRRQASLPLWAILGFVIFLFSMIVWPDPLMPQYSVAVHFWLLSFVISAYLMFSEQQVWTAVLAGCTLAVLSIYSFAGGFVTSAIVLISYALFKCTRLGTSDNRRREIVQLAAAIFIIGGAIVSWLIDYQRPAYIPGLAWPYQKSFWGFFLNVLSFSFGFDTMSQTIGVGCLLVVIIPIAGEIWRRRARLSVHHWFFFAVTLALLADLCAVSMGRANGFGIGWSKVGEYPEHGMPLIVLSAVNWGIFCENRLTRIIVVSAFWALCCAAFADNWDFTRYDRSAVKDLATYRCVEAYYAGTGEGHCQGTFGTYPHPEVLLDKAKRLNLSFYREMMKEIRTPPSVEN